MFGNSEVDYRNLILWLAVVIFIIGSSLYSILRRVPSEKRAQNLIGSGVVALIIGIAAIGVICYTTGIPWHVYKGLLSQVFLFKKHTLSKMQKGTADLTIYYAVAASGIILSIIGVLRIIYQTGSPAISEQPSTEKMVTKPADTVSSGNVDVREIFHNKNFLLILAAFSVPMLVVIFGIYWYWYGSPVTTAAIPGESPPYTVGSKPMGIAIDASGNVWVASRGTNSVTKLNPSGTVIGSYRVGKSPVGIAIDASGNVWVADLGSNSVTKLSPDGHTLGTFTSGSGPYGITIDASGNAWVANFKDNTVTKLTPSGSVLGIYPVASRGPFGLGGGINGIVVDASGNIWVTNDDDNSVIKLAPSGSIIGTYPVGGSPVGLAIDHEGNVLIACANGITELGPDGNRIATYDNQELATGPESIAIDAAGNIWVSVTSDSDVVELSPDGTILKTYMIGQSHEGIVIDASGNVWIANFINSTVSEIIGAAKGPQYFPYKGPQFPGGGNI